MEYSWTPFSRSRKVDSVRLYTTAHLPILVYWPAWKAWTASAITDSLTLGIFMRCGWCRQGFNNWMWVAVESAETTDHGNYIRHVTQSHTCRTSVIIWPVAARNWSPAIHSFVLRRVSRAKSCKWVTSRSRTNLNRGFGLFELFTITFSVIFFCPQVLQR